MLPSVYEQTMVFLRAFITGAFLAAVYTFFSCIRVLSPKDMKLQFIRDLIFSLFAGIVSFLYALSCTGGRFRGYAAAAELASFLVLYLTLGRLIVNSAHKISKVIARVWSRLTDPVRRMMSGICAALQLLCHKVLKKFKKSKI